MGRVLLNAIYSTYFFSGFSLFIGEPVAKRFFMETLYCIKCTTKKISNVQKICFLKNLAKKNNF